MEYMNETSKLVYIFRMLLYKYIIKPVQMHYLNLHLRKYITY